MIAGSFIFTLFITLSKTLSTDFDPGFLAFWRSLIGVIMMAPLFYRLGRGVLKVHRPVLILARSLFSTIGFVMGFYAVSDAMGLSLAEYNGISFSRALFLTMLAALLLKEAVGIHRWGATLVGFIGVLIMADIDGGTLLGVSLAIGSAAFLAAGITMVKILTADHSPVTLLIWANILSTLLILPIAILNWPQETVPWSQWAWIGVMSASGVIGQYFFIRAMSVGHASFLAPIDYLRLPMAAGVDLIIFKIWPEANLWVGAAIIIGATLYITMRERAQKAKAPPL